MKMNLAVNAMMAFGNFCAVNSSQRDAISKNHARRQNDHVTLNSPELNLSPDFVITSTPQTRNYVFEITEEIAAMDGFERRVLVINRQFPGPLIEANDGDTLDILVKNHITQPVAIHWHGIWQKGTPWMDGVSGVTQCPIPAGASFTYSFKIDDQFGTFWYHAHSQNLAADGLMGPLIVHSVNDPLKRGRDYDNDIVLMYTDWYHELSTVMLNAQISPELYNGSWAGPSPNSALVNGIGYFDCANAESGSTCKQNNINLELKVAPNEKTRIRLIQGAAHAMFRFSVDGHPLKIIETDATGVNGPSQIHRLPFHAGQRYSVILDTSNDQVGSSFLLRSVMDPDCYYKGRNETCLMRLRFSVAPGIEGRARSVIAVVQVVAKEEKGRCGCSSSDTPNTPDQENEPVGGPCVDVEGDLTPLMPKSVPNVTLGKRILDTTFGTIGYPDPKNASHRLRVGRFFVNEVPWGGEFTSRSLETHVFKPLLAQMMKGGNGKLNETEVGFVTLEEPGWYDIVINNLDQGLDHPYHLHGVDSYLVSKGNGRLIKNSTIEPTEALSNPNRRDTYVIPGGSYIIIRILANNPGVFMLHCHVGWHLGSGFAGVLVMQPRILSTWQEPAVNRALCRVTAGSHQNDTETEFPIIPQL
ncbi:multi-copper oxidase laccase-like protein [Melampsora larici-populina 98AG31]|uniref:Multi-copper oxidase laccase-like protein n=1 Tax=Melampsora larici-populina (strain 98AG31 / pathotype 3-4-7) TaxID=747676 RepID=F4RHU0_MELLP|nr:multi-copper oxidase laccase-like protein [Melampsora larici-populina 98AG31]EGG07886.1 multi-copper oxidase laccase-like protein [Melampsora larici-populina 98AG31]